MEKLSWRRDVTAGAVSALLGVVFIVEAMRITPDPSAFKVLGPRVIPLVVGIAAVAISLAFIAQGLREGRKSDPDATSPQLDSLGDSTGEDGGGWATRKRILVTFALFAVYVVVFIPLGYVLSTFAFLFALTTYVDREKWRRNAIFAAVFSVAVYFLFVNGLRVQLPLGVLG